MKHLLGPRRVTFFTDALNVSGALLGGAKIIKKQ